jgi:hypothetical protein
MVKRKAKKKTVRKRTTRKRTVKKAKPEDSLHVMVNSPVTKRREILSITLASVELLKKFKTIKAIQVEKRKELNNFKDIWKQIHSDLREIRLKELPLGQKGLDHVHGLDGRIIKVPKPLKVKKVVHRAPKVKAAKVVPLRKSSLDSQLDALRRKLDML